MISSIKSFASASFTAFRRLWSIHGCQFRLSGVEASVLEESIYSHIQNKLGLEVGTSVVRVKGIRPDDREKQFMNLTNQDFLMRVEQVAYLTDGRTFEYSYADHLPETFEFETVITAKIIKRYKIG